jgi:hypothetical protein
MTEFSGYIPLKPMDWGAVAQEATKPITDVIKDRENQRKELNKFNQDSLAEANKYDQSKAPSGAEFIMTASQNARSYIMAQYQLLTSGQITPEEYKRKVQNGRESFKNLNVYIQNINKDLEEAQGRVDRGDAGSFEVFLNEQRANLLNLRGKNPTFSDEGFMYVVGTDGVVNDLQSVNMGANKRPLKVNVIESVDAAVKNLGVGAMDKNGVYTISEKLVGDWKKTQESIANSMLDNNTKIYSVLADNMTGYSLTTDPKQVNENTILVKTDANGEMVPQITEEQKKKAREYIAMVIEGRVSVKGKDMSEDKKLDMDRQKIALRYAEMNREDRKLYEPVIDRIEAIRKISNGDAGIIVGRPMSYQEALGAKDASGKVSKKYPGYVVNSVSKRQDGKYSVSIKSGDGDVKELVYTESGLISDLNSVLNNMPGETKVPITKINSLYEKIKGGGSSTNNSRGELD